MLESDRDSERREANTDVSCVLALVLSPPLELQSNGSGAANICHCDRRIATQKKKSKSRKRLQHDSITCSAYKQAERSAWE
eukprot:2270920-Rhodomonas_salina.2